MKLCIAFWAWIDEQNRQTNKTDFRVGFDWCSLHVLTLGAGARYPRRLGRKRRRLGVDYFGRDLTNHGRLRQNNDDDNDTLAFREFLVGYAYSRLSDVFPYFKAHLFQFCVTHLSKFKTVNNMHTHFAYWRLFYVDLTNDARHPHMRLNWHRHARHDRQNRLVVSGVAMWIESARPPETSAFSVGVCRAAQALPVRPLDALRRRTGSWAVGPTQFTPPDTTQTALSCRVWRAVWIGFELAAYKMIRHKLFDPRSTRTKASFCTEPKIKTKIKREILKTICSKEPALVKKEFVEPVRRTRTFRHADKQFSYHNNLRRFARKDGLLPKHKAYVKEKLPHEASARELMYVPYWRLDPRGLYAISVAYDTHLSNKWRDYFGRDEIWTYSAFQDVAKCRDYALESDWSTGF